MTDLVGIFESYSDSLGWQFTYGNAANNNLLQTDLETNNIYFMLDPLTRVKNKSEYGGLIDTTFSSSFMLIKMSDLDEVYPNKYEKNIKPLLLLLESFEDLVDCSDYQIINWSVIDAIDVLDGNMDGVIVTFSLKI